MVIKFNNYCGPYVYASIAFSHETVNRIVSKNHNALLVSKHSFTLYPTNTELTTDNKISFINTIREYDVVKIFESGLCRLSYTALSNSNAIVVTSRCNSNCLMCPGSEHSRRTGLISSITDLCAFVEYIPYDAPHITITGGEPTLLKMDFFGLMECINENLPYTQQLYLTNARAFCNEQYAVKFNSLATEYAQIAVPIHGSTGTIHDSITQVAGSFHQTLLALHNIASSKAEIEIRIVVNKINLVDLPNIAKLVIDNIPRVTCVNFVALEMSGSAALHRSAVWVDYDEAFNYIAPCCTVLLKAGIDVSLYNFPLCSVNKEYWDIARQSISDYKVRYVAECEECRVKEICGGQFTSTAALRLYNVKPIRRLQ